MDGQTSININGKNVGVKFNRYGVEEAGKIKGNISLYKNVIAQIWGGIQGYAFAKQVEPEITFEELLDWLDSIYLTNDQEDVFKKIDEAFKSSLLYKSLNPAEPVEPAEPETEESAKKNTEQIPTSDE